MAQRWDSAERPDAHRNASHPQNALLESGGTLDFHYGNEKEFQFEPAKVDWEFNDGDIIKLGDIQFKFKSVN